jgi:hypothetical protein
MGVLMPEHVALQYVLQQCVGVLLRWCGRPWASDIVLPHAACMNLKQVPACAELMLMLVM